MLHIPMLHKHTNESEELEIHNVKVKAWERVKGKNGTWETRILGGRRWE